ncbi:MAG: hypothetical protein NT151_07085 [Acidobacteria bacterium]|nr:hypothetical protein [Acidobacteriota bacterium]
MTSIIAAFTDGARRVWRAPAILAGVYLLILITTTLPGLVVREDIAASLGPSAEADTMLKGVSLEWWDQFGESASGLSRSFSPTIIGFGATLDNLSRVLDNGTLPVAVLALAGAYMLVWLLLAGGILDRFARNRATRRQAFFGACGVYFPRFLRLGILGLVGYWLLFAYVHGWLFERLWNAATHDMTVERTAFLLRLALYAAFGALLVFWNVVLDYAKIRAVVEDRYSMLGALLAAWRFVIRKPAAVGGLYLLNGSCFVVVLLLYALVAPGAGGGGLQIWTGFAIGQIFILARLFVKLMFYASQTALFQESLAHAAYTAAPVPVWPDSPGAEAIVNAAERRP